MCFQRTRYVSTSTGSLVNVDGEALVKGAETGRFIFHRLCVWVPHNRATDLCVGASSSSRLNAAPPTPSAAGIGSPGSITGGASADEEQSCVSSATGSVSGEGPVSMSEKTSSLMAMGSRLAVTGTSSALPVPSGVTSSFEGAESEAARAPGEAASLESGGRFRWRGADEESRGWGC